MQAASKTGKANKPKKKILKDGQWIVWGSDYDATSLYAHPKRWGERPHHPLNSGLKAGEERSRYEALTVLKDKQSQLPPDKVLEIQLVKQHLHEKELAQMKQDEIDEIASAAQTQLAQNRAGSPRMAQSAVSSPFASGVRDLDMTVVHASQNCGSTATRPQTSTMQADQWEDEDKVEFFEQIMNEYKEASEVLEKVRERIVSRPPARQETQTFTAVIKRDLDEMTLRYTKTRSLAASKTIRSLGLETLQGSKDDGSESS